MTTYNPYEFYKGRIDSCPSYGYKSGHEILSVILTCVHVDPTLTEEETNSIIKQAELCHIKMMEDKNNEG